MFPRWQVVVTSQEAMIHVEVQIEIALGKLIVKGAQKLPTQPICPIILIS
jgi:hypothetical protein